MINRFLASSLITILRRLLPWCSILFILESTAQVSRPPAAAEKETIEAIVISAMPASGVIDLLAELSGKTILRAQAVPEIKLSLNLNQLTKKADAIRAIESLLFLNGIATIPMGEQFTKVLPIASVKSHAQSIIQDTALKDLPDSEQNYARIFNLSYLSSQEALKQITPFVSGSGQVLELGKSNALYVNDTLSNLKRIELLLTKSDQALDLSQKVQFVALQHIAAPTLLKQLNRIKDGPLKAAFGSGTTFEADERSNQMLVFSHPKNLPSIMALIEQMDVDVAPTTRSELISIDHAVAAEVATLIQSIINEQQSKQDKDSAQSPTGQTAANTESPVEPPANQQQNKIVAPAAVPKSGTNTPTSDLFSPFATIVSDERSNAIIAYGTEYDIDQIRYLVDQIDIPLPLVQIDVVITEVTLSHDQARGIDAFNLSLNPRGLLETLGEYDYGIGTTSGSNLSPPLSVEGSLSDFSLNLIFDTARRNSDVRVLQAPSITVSHNAEGEINIGERRPIITSSTSDITDTNNVRSQVSYEQVGIDLAVTPLIGKNGAIQLKISQEISSVTGTVEIDGNDQPIIGNRVANSEVSVNNNETIVLGGLQEESETRTQARMALFGRIPVLGKLLEGRSNEDERREIIIFIKPKILNLTEVQSTNAKTTIQNSQHSEKLQNFFEKRRFQLNEDADTE
jgi:general secretion pathway protein D